MNYIYFENLLYVEQINIKMEDDIEYEEQEWKNANWERNRDFKDANRAKQQETTESLQKCYWT